MASFGFGATLALRLRRTGAAFEFAAGLPPGATLARGSAATRIDASGKIATEAAHAARLDHDPLTLAARGLLIEPAATNLLLASESFDTASWANAGTTVTGDAAASPAATATADRIVETTLTGQHRQTQSVATSAGQAYTFSVFAKAGERSRVLLRLIGSSTVAAATFNLAARTVSGVTGAAAMTELGGGWFRLAVSGVADAAAGACHVNLVDDTGSSSYAGVAGQGLLVWGAQAEAGAATSYVATTTASAARAADGVSLDWGGKGAADGAATVRYTFDDGSTQDVAATIAGGAAAMPTTLARARIRRAGLV